MMICWFIKHLNQTQLVNLLATIHIKSPAMNPKRYEMNLDGIYLKDTNGKRHACNIYHKCAHKEKGTSVKK